MRPIQAPLLVLALLTLALSAASLLSPAGPSLARIDTRANVFESSEQGWTSLAVAGDGQVVAAWESRRQEAGRTGVYARLLDAAGRPASPEVRLHDPVRGDQRRPAVAWGEGGVWFAWEAWGRDGSGSSVVARRFDHDLAPAGPELGLNSTRPGDQAEPAVAAGPAGALVAWTDTGVEPSVIRARRPQSGTAEATVSASGSSADGHPSVAPLGADGFVVAWSRAGEGVLARRVDALGVPRGAEWTLSEPGREAIEPTVAPLDGGRFVAAWLEREGRGWAAVTRLFSDTGEPLAPTVVAASSAGGWNSGVTVASAPDGGWAVAWNRDDSPEGGELRVRRFDADGRVTGPARALHPTATGRRAMTVGGAARAAFTPAGALAVAWAGAAPNDAHDHDATAARVSLLLPPRVAARTALEPPRPGTDRPARRTSSDDLLTASPPLWNPDFRPQARRAVAAGGDFGFEAIPGTGWTPPDPEMAVGTDRILVMTNGAIAAFDRLGALQWQDEIENSFGFWGELGADNFVFDPEVTWDPHANRFVAMACERSDDNRSTFLLAISKDDSPDDRDDWHKWRLDVTDLAGNDIDSPNLAVGPDAILLTADFFVPDAYLILVIDKASVIDGGTPIVVDDLITGFSQQSMGIPVVYSDDPTLYILQSTESGLNDTVIVHAITDPFTAYNRQTFTLSVPEYTYPNQPPQKGTSSRPFLFEPRFWSVAEHNGSLWAVHHVNSTRARVRWYEIDLGGWPAGGTPSLAQTGEIDLGGDLHTYFPSIHVDAAENVAITYARSSADEYISIGRSLRSAGDPPSTLRPTQVVQVSRNAHTSGRWGDYSGTQADPVQPDSFWGHHEFTDGALSSWRTWVARYDLRPEAMRLSVDPLVAGSPATLRITGATPGVSVRFAASLTGVALTEVPILQAVLSLDAPRPVGSAVADGSGEALLVIQVPPGAAGRTIVFQAAETGHTSNWIETTVQ